MVRLRLYISILEMITKKTEGQMKTRVIVVEFGIAAIIPVPEM